MLDDLPKGAKNSLALNLGVTAQTWFPVNEKHRVHCVRIIRDSPWALGRLLSPSPLFPIAKKNSEILKEKEGKEKGAEIRGDFICNLCISQLRFHKLVSFLQTPI